MVCFQHPVGHVCACLGPDGHGDAACRGAAASKPRSVNACLHVCICLYIYVLMYVYMYVCMHACMYIYVLYLCVITDSLMLPRFGAVSPSGALSSSGVLSSSGAPSVTIDFACGECTNRSIFMYSGFQFHGHVARMDTCEIYI